MAGADVTEIADDADPDTGVLRFVAALRAVTNAAARVARRRRRRPSAVALDERLHVEKRR